MSSLLQARDDYAAALRTLPGVQVFVHGGTFNQKELERYSRAAPALVISLLRFDPQIQAGIVTAEAHWGCVVFTKEDNSLPKDPQGASRARTCIALAEAACAVLLRLFAGVSLAAASRPHSFEARNMYSTPLDGIGIAMWSFEWLQTIDLPETITPVDFSIDAVWDLAPRDNGADLGDVPEAEDLIDVSP